ncbi:hypothetical protein ACLB2K_002362 [Fragaria x ananassa]
MEDMKKKLTELAKANEELVNKNTELLGKLKKADIQIIELEKERRAHKNEINALKKQLHKEAKHAQTKQIIRVTKEKEEEEDRSKPVEEEEYKCREEQPGTEEFFEQVAEPDMLRKIFPEDDEPVTTDLLDEKVANHYKNWFDLNKDKNDDFRYWECCDGIIDITKDDLKRIIQEGEITSNTIRVYLAMLKEEMEKKKVSVGFLDIEAARTAVVHEQKLKEFLAGGGKQGEFKCNELDIELSIVNPLWSIFSKDLVFISLHHGVSHHYTLVLIDNEAQRFYHLNSMLPPMKDYSADTNNHLQNAMAMVKHIMVFIKFVYDSTKYPLSQGLDLRNGGKTMTSRKTKE